MHFSLNQLPELRSYSPLARVQILNLALKRLSGPEKVLLNLLKLCLIVPPFFLLARLGPWFAALGIIFVLVGFSLVSRPLQLYFAKPHIEGARQEFEQQQGPA